MLYIGYHIISLPRYTVLFSHIHMHGGLADAEPGGGAADSGFVLDDVKRKRLRPLLHVTLH